MSLQVRRAVDRGHADHGWLRSHHTFSFADYHDPKHMGFRSLRVINDDHVLPGRGFSTHPHRDMEIFSYVLAGAIEHQDSMGNGRILRPGEVQLMSAGTGVLHSEFNPSQTEELHLLQIWILPSQRNLKPTYTEWHPTPESESAPLVTIISPDGREGSAIIHQDAIVQQIKLRAGASITHRLASGRGLWLQVASGSLSLLGETLSSGDGASTESPSEVTMTATTEVLALLFDLA